MQVSQDKPFIIAYYLPQYHPIPENDEWWGKGFTEWTNVAKAKPLFKGHYQPKIPADLGFYDLRVPEVRELQAELACEAGVDGFCYWHYWFGNGKELLERPFKEVVESGKPDFPFCLGWANEDWQAKLWNFENTSNKNAILIRQNYPGTDDITMHFYAYFNAFKDKRYIRINGKPLFHIYRPIQMTNLREFTSIWNKLAKENNLADSFYFTGQVNSQDEYFQLIDSDISAFTFSPTVRLGKTPEEKVSLRQQFIQIVKRKRQVPHIIDYEKSISFLWQKEIDIQENIIPTLLPNWDHSPRSGIFAQVLINSSPLKFQSYCQKVLEEISKKENKIIFLKSWNEWGEGNYMEPDLKFGKRYIKALANARKNTESK